MGFTLEPLDASQLNSICSTVSKELFENSDYTGIMKRAYFPNSTLLVKTPASLFQLQEMLYPFFNRNDYSLSIEEKPLNIRRLDGEAADNFKYYFLTVLRVLKDEPPLAQ